MPDSSVTDSPKSPRALAPSTGTTKLPRQRKFDHGAALELALNGWRYSEIASRYAVSESAVAQALAKYQNLLNGLQNGELESYRKNRTELFTATERELMASLTHPDKLAKASLNNVAYAFQQIHTARRLEEGKSTENKSIITAMLDGAHDKLFTPVTQPVVDNPPIIPVDSEVVENTAKEWVRKLTYSLLSDKEVDLLTQQCWDKMHAKL